jgi:hypothetical protein
MTTSEWSSLLESFSAESYASGFSPEEAVKLFIWWKDCPRENAFTACLFLDDPEELYDQVFPPWPFG